MSALHKTYHLAHLHSKPQSDFVNSQAHIFLYIFNVDLKCQSQDVPIQN